MSNVNIVYVTVFECIYLREGFENEFQKVIETQVVLHTRQASIFRYLQQIIELIWSIW